MSDESNFEGLSSLVRLSGTSVPARARFVGETLLGSSISGLTLGLMWGSVGATFFPLTIGPLVPFLWGSGVGYTFGLVYQWRLAKRRAIVTCENYPALMVHSLRWEWNVRDLPYNKDQGDALAKWILQGSVSRLSLAMLASQTCAPAVEEIQQRNRQRIVDAYAEEEDKET
jgi:hypothetical protein